MHVCEFRWAFFTFKKLQKCCEVYGFHNGEDFDDGLLDYNIL